MRHTMSSEYAYASDVLKPTLTDCQTRSMILEAQFPRRLLSTETMKEVLPLREEHDWETTMRVCDQPLARRDATDESRWFVR